MERPDQSPGPEARFGAPALHILFPGDQPSVRRALRTAMGVFRALPLEGSLPDTVEIVLAEVLNNVVEHAYGENRRGLVEVEVTRVPAALSFRIRDEGDPMPDRTPPPGRVHDLDVATDALPEGGFGWFLIRELTEDLAYRRVGTRNELTFRIRADAKMPGT